MARRPKPTALKLISGSRRLPANPEPQPVGDLNEAPDWLTESQKKGWDYAIEHAPRGLLKMLDRSVLTIWVVAEDTHRQAAQKVAEEGMTITARTGLEMQNPHLAIVNKQAAIMLRTAAELGFSPVSRSGIAFDSGSGGNPFLNNGRRP